MIRDAVFLILGILLAYIFIMFSNYGIKLPHKSIQNHIHVVIKMVSPTPTKEVKGLDSTTFQYIVQTFGKDANTAIAVAHATSNFNCADDDGNSDVGLFGINTIAHDFGTTDSKDCITNIDMAKKIFDQNGWNDFPRYIDGSYKKFL